MGALFTRLFSRGRSPPPGSQPLALTLQVDEPPEQDNPTRMRLHVLHLSEAIVHQRQLEAQLERRIAEWHAHYDPPAKKTKKTKVPAMARQQLLLLGKQRQMIEYRILLFLAQQGAIEIGLQNQEDAELLAQTSRLLRDVAAKMPEGGVAALQDDLAEQLVMLQGETEALMTLAEPRNNLLYQVRPEQTEARIGLQLEDDAPLLAELEDGTEQQEEEERAPRQPARAPRHGRSHSVDNGAVLLV